MGKIKDTMRRGNNSKQITLESIVQSDSIYYPKLCDIVDKRGPANPPETNSQISQNSGQEFSFSITMDQNSKR